MPQVPHVVAFLHRQHQRKTVQSLAMSGSLQRVATSVLTNIVSTFMSFVTAQVLSNTGFSAPLPGLPGMAALGIPGMPGTAGMSGGHPTAATWMALLRCCVQV